MDSKELIRYQVAQAAEKREMMGRPTNDKILTASFKAFELNLNWQVENVRKGVGVLSGFLNCQRFPKTFLFGLRYNEEVATVSLTILNLNHLGMRVALVRLTCNDGKTVLMNRKNSEKRASKLDYFTLEFEQGLDSVCCFTCRVYLEGVVDTYIHQQYDQLLDDQLWTYAQCSCWTDLKFSIGEKVFHAHKFVICARSSRLAAEFGHGDSIRLSEDLDPETFKCFLHFLYTGRLMLVHFKTTMCHQLLTLAEKYGVETLKQLCQTDLEKMTTDEFPKHFMSTGPPATSTGKEKPLVFDLKPKSEMCIQPDSTEIRFSWDINFLPEDTLIRSVDFNHQEAFQVCFRSGFELEEGKQNPSIFIFSKQWLEYGIDVITVNIVIKTKSSIDGKTSNSKRFPASQWKKVAGLEPAMAIFSTDLPDSLSPPFTIIFMIDLSCKSVGNYSYQLRDANYADSLWSASFNGLLTDVEFVVDGRTFKAHKALMAARSPVFRELFNSNGIMRESVSQRVALDDLDSHTFENVLHFIYTGTLRVSACDPKLFVAADKYQIETLKFLCENQVRQRDRSHQDLFSFLSMVA